MKAACELSHGWWAHFNKQGENEGHPGQESEHRHRGGSIPVVLNGPESGWVWSMGRNTLEGGNEQGLYWDSRIQWLGLSSGARLPGLATSSGKWLNFSMIRFPFMQTWDYRVILRIKQFYTIPMCKVVRNRAIHITTQQKMVANSGEGPSNSASGKQELTQPHPRANFGKCSWWWLKGPLFRGGSRKVKLSGPCIPSDLNLLYSTLLQVWALRPVSQVSRH